MDAFNIESKINELKRKLMELVYVLIFIKLPKTQLYKLFNRKVDESEQCIKQVLDDLLDEARNVFERANAEKMKLMSGVEKLVKAFN